MGYFTIFFYLIVVNVNEKINQIQRRDPLCKIFIHFFNIMVLIIPIRTLYLRALTAEESQTD